MYRLKLPRFKILRVISGYRKPCRTIENGLTYHFPKTAEGEGFRPPRQPADGACRVAPDPYLAGGG